MTKVGLFQISLFDALTFFGVRAGRVSSDQRQGEFLEDS